MLKPEIIDKLNHQLNLEFFSSNLYLQMSAWCDDKSFTSIARFLREHAQEEMQHMQRLFDYLSDTGALPIIGSIDAPDSQYESILEVFRKTYEHELYITKQINELVHLAFSMQDYSTFNFLQWYVAEQHEEEKLFKTILDKLELAGDNKSVLFFIDKDFEQMLSQSGLSQSQQAG